MFYLVLTTIVVAAAAACVVYQEEIEDAQYLINAAIMWEPVRHVYAVFAVYLVSETLMIPGSIMSVFIGYTLSAAYNDSCRALVVGTPVLCLATLISAIVSFVFAKLMPNCVSAYFKKKFPIIEATNSSTQTDRLLLVFLTRLIPMAPMSMVNFLIGLTNTSVTDFFVSLIGNVLSVFLYLFMGTSINDLFVIMESKNHKFHDNSTFLVISTIGSLYCVAGIIWTIILTYRHYCYILEMHSLANDDCDHLEINSNDA